MASSRAPAPSPLYIEKHRTSSSSSSSSSAAMSPDYFNHHSRTSSGSSGSSSDSAAYSPGSRGGAASPRNVYTHCGRHTDQFLFGGKGFTDMWRAFTKKE